MYSLEAKHCKEVVLGLTVEVTVRSAEGIVKQFPLSNSGKKRRFGSPLSINNPDKVGKSLIPFSTKCFI